MTRPRSGSAPNHPASSKKTRVSCIGHGQSRAKFCKGMSTGSEMKLSFFLPLLLLLLLLFFSFSPLFVIRFHQRDPNSSHRIQPPAASFNSLNPPRILGASKFFKECLRGPEKIVFLESPATSFAAPISIVMCPCADTCERTSAPAPEQRTGTGDSDSESVSRNAGTGHHRTVDWA